MVKSHRIGGQIGLVVGVISVMSSGVFAEKGPVAPSNQFMQCHTSLKRFSLHLEKCKERTNQAYYENLYNQTQSFLGTLENIPINSAHLEKCENLLKAIQDIVGKHAADPDLAPMPTYSNSYSGKLTMPALDSRRRPLPKNVHVRYVCEDQAALKRETANREEGEDLEGLPLVSKPSALMSRTRKRNPSGEPKELE